MCLYVFLPWSDFCSERNQMFSMLRGRMRSWSLSPDLNTGIHTAGQSLTKWNEPVISVLEMMLGHQHRMPSAKVATETVVPSSIRPQFGLPGSFALTL